MSLLKRENLLTWEISHFLKPEAFQHVYDILRQDPEWSSFSQEKLDTENEKFAASCFVAQRRFETIQDDSLQMLYNWAPWIFYAYYFVSVIGSSEWGIAQRNTQWAQRIKEVEKEYDIVIVWCGTGHIDDANSFALSYLMTSPDYVCFIFTLPDLDKRIQLDKKGSLNFYLKLSELHLEDNSKLNDKMEPTQEEEEKILSLTSHINPDETFYGIYDPKKIRRTDEFKKKLDEIGQKMNKFIDMKKYLKNTSKAKVIGVYLR